MQGEKQRVSFPRVCTPLRSLLKCPRGQPACSTRRQVCYLRGVKQSKALVAAGCHVHPAGAQCGTRCPVETCRNSLCMPGHAVHSASGVQLRLGPGQCNACNLLVCKAAYGARWKTCGHCMQGHGVHSISGAPAAAGPWRIHLSVKGWEGGRKKERGNTHDCWVA